MRQRIEARLILEQQLMDQKKRKEREENDEKLFCEKQLQMLAERDKIEQLSNEKRRRKILEHRKAIQEMLEQRKLERVEAMATEIRMREIEEEDKKRKYVIIIYLLYVSLHVTNILFFYSFPYFYFVSCQPTFIYL